MRNHTGLVTGANRGLGYETCRQLAIGNPSFHVILTARRVQDAHEAARRLGMPGNIEPLQLDVTDSSSIERAASQVRDSGVRIDALVNNAAVLLDGFDAETARRTIAVNVHGPIAVTDAFRPLLSDRPSIVMVSSGLGELTCLSPSLRARFEDPGLSRADLRQLMNEFFRDVADGTYASKGWPRSAYNVSKVGLNAFTRLLARELEAEGIRRGEVFVNAVCPGWVRTDMGGRGATRSVEEGARGIVWAARLALASASAPLPGGRGPTGGFFRDRQPIPW